MTKKSKSDTQGNPNSHIKYREKFSGQKIFLSSKENSSLWLLYSLRDFSLGEL